MKGILLDNITLDELDAKFDRLHKRIDRLEKLLAINVREDFTLAELAALKGYSKRHLRRIIEDDSIPFSYKGQEIVISREHAATIKPKTTITNAQLN